MQYKNVSAVYYSPTDTSKKGAKAIAEVFGNVCEYDLTNKDFTAPDKIFTKEDVVVFSAPVYAGRICDVAMERIKTFKAEDAIAVATVTYGNRDYDDALLELCDTLKENGFIIAGAAALIGQHTYGEVQIGRPNADDIVEDKEFAEKVLQKIEKAKCRGCFNEIEVKGNRPYKDGGKGGKFQPETNENCINCKVCAKKCPTGAISMDDVRVVDKEKCTSCARCIKYCPKGAKAFLSDAYKATYDRCTSAFSVRRENEYML